jgi:flagellar basal body-associated protein FliL
MGDAGDAAKAASEGTEEHGHEAAPAGHGAPAPSAHADSGHGGGGGHGASAHGSGGHGGGGHGAGGHGTTNPNATVAFVNFGDIVVNLDEGRLNRYLRLKIMLQVKPQDEGIVTTEMETQRTVLKSWLLSYLSDKTLSDIRGAAGQGMLRREIQEYFNTTLFPDGKDRVYDVLFDEFNIQ